MTSRAVRISAMRVEVKCTVLSSAMGMFILTRRCTVAMGGPHRETERNTQLHLSECFWGGSYRREMCVCVCVCVCVSECESV